jgi:serralysin
MTSSRCRRSTAPTGSPPIAATTYAFADKRYFQTIFDTGGNDTIVYSGTDTCNINLNIGSFCAVGKVIQFNGGSSRATVAIGPNTVIENATGGARNDRIVGNSANNNLKGSGGHDSLYGGAGSDTITGGSSTDKLKGNSGADLFDFNKLSEIGTTSHDIIVDFKPGVDDIDLSTIDANSLVAGNDLFSFKAKADASLNGHAGELCWYNSSGKTFVIGDINGDKVADFKLELTGTLTLTAGDFIL